MKMNKLMNALSGEPSIVQALDDSPCVRAIWEQLHAELDSARDYQDLNTELDRKLKDATWQIEQLKAERARAEKLVPKIEHPTEEEVNFLKEGQLIMAIKSVRNRSILGLKDAKDLAESWRDDLRGDGFSCVWTPPISQ